MLLEQGSFSLYGMALPCVDRAGCGETDPVYLLSVEWVTDPFVLVHAFSYLLGAMLAAMLSCVVCLSALVGHCPFGGLAQWWLIHGFQMFMVSRKLAATLDAACAAWSLLCVLCFRILQGFRGNVKVKESGAWEVMWTISLYFTILQAMDGCGIRRQLQLRLSSSSPTAAACSPTAAASVHVIAFVVDFLSAAASVQVITSVVDFWAAAASLHVIAFVVDFWSAAALSAPAIVQVIALVVHCLHVMGLRIRRAVCAVALTVHTRVFEPLRLLEVCGSAVPWIRCCGAVLKAAAFAFVDCVTTDVSEFVDMAMVGWSCHVHKGSRLAFEEAKATPRVDVAETPQASPFLGAHGKEFLQPGPSLVSFRLTGQTLVVRWSSSELNGKHLTEEALHAMDRFSLIPLVVHGRLRGGSSSVPGDWVCSRCHTGGYAMDMEGAPPVSSVSPVSSEESAAPTGAQDLPDDSG